MILLYWLHCDCDTHDESVSHWWRQKTNSNSIEPDRQHRRGGGEIYIRSTPPRQISPSSVQRVAPVGWKPQNRPLAELNITACASCNAGGNYTYMQIWQMFAERQSASIVLAARSNSNPVKLTFTFGLIPYPSVSTFQIPSPASFKDDSIQMLKWSGN